MRAFHGNVVGSKAKHTYVCADRACGAWQPTKRPVCIACGKDNMIHFPSKAEAKRYAELCQEAVVGRISGLEIQKPFHLVVVNANLGIELTIGKYVSDFAYKRDGISVVEDVKGKADTTLSKWKRKHAETQYGITINIIRR